MTADSLTDRLGEHLQERLLGASLPWGCGAGDAGRNNPICAIVSVRWGLFRLCRLSRLSRISLIRKTIVKRLSNARRRKHLKQRAARAIFAVWVWKEFYATLTPHSFTLCPPRSSIVLPVAWLWAWIRRCRRRQGRRHL